MTRREIDSPYAWFRLAISMLLGTLGGAGMWSVVVALPAVQAGFHAERGAASLPFTLTMIGFGVGGVFMGRLADRKGIVLPVLIGCGSIAAASRGAMLKNSASNSSGCHEVRKPPLRLQMVPGTVWSSE